MKMKKSVLLSILLLFAVMNVCANTRVSIAQVTEAVTVSDDVDYYITGAEPITSTGSINITNTEHAVIIMTKVKPSVAKSYLKYIKINGTTANSTNSQLKMYNNGSILLPYPLNCNPLTTYPEYDFVGTPCNNYGLGNTGGYMNTLTEEQYNNRIRSFKLKHGYMVTFSLQEGGRGYSRCFIADNEDLEMNLPSLMANRISSYRIFQWNNASKKGIASTDGTKIINALNASWCYTWAEGQDRYPDAECVPNHIYEDYPSSAACGSVTWACHMKTNNEPRNSADDHPQDLNTILNNWENLMRTGMRLLSPTSWDGSDYWDGSGFIKQFLDSIDARGWRCDIVDAHCYWVKDNFSRLQNNWRGTLKRPIWVSEWIWGASWNKNGCWGSGVTDTDILNNTKSILSTLNSSGVVERYAYWNGESKGHVYVSKNDSLTPLGEYYASMNTGLGYNKSYEFVPTTPPLADPSNFTVTFNMNALTNSLRWYNKDGELDNSMVVERKIGNGSWEVIATIDLKDGPSYYSFVDSEGRDGYTYRIHTVDMNGRNRYSAEVRSAHKTITYGDPVTTDEGTTLYLGGNIVSNGDFTFGSSGWTNGKQSQITYPDFQVTPLLGPDKSNYLQAYSNSSLTNNGAVCTSFNVESGQYYYASAYHKDNGGNNYQNFALSNDGTTEDGVVLTMPAASEWTRTAASFNTGSHSKVLLALRWLGNSAKFDKVMVCKLFPTRDEAISDALQKEQLRANAFKAWNSRSNVNTDLQAYIDNAEGTDEEKLAYVTAAIDMAIGSLPVFESIDSLYDVGNAAVDMGLTGFAQLRSELDAAYQSAQETFAFENVAAIKAEMQSLIDDYLSNLKDVTSTTLKTPDFTSGSELSADGWITKCGTHTGGDQRTNTYAGRNCWNAWWSGINASEGTAKTMAIKQELTDLPSGFYILECKAATQHYCLSDQHAFISNGTDTQVSPTLTWDRSDLPDINNADVWQTLATKPIFLSLGETLTVGFMGSKQGAIDNAYKPYNSTTSGDKREGWWYATDFKLKQLPLFKAPGKTGKFATICLPYKFTYDDNVKIYQIAGITADYQWICVEEVTSTRAGYPYIYLPEEDNVSFYETGSASTRARTSAGLTGSYTELEVPTGCYYLINGEFYSADDVAGSIDPYTAYISRFSRLTVQEAWTGDKIRIHVAESDLPTGIEAVEADGGEAGKTYTIGGVKAPKDYRGIIIQNGKKGIK